jgi:hypothetical protein
MEHDKASWVLYPVQYILFNNFLPKRTHGTDNFENAVFIGWVSKVTNYGLDSQGSNTGRETSTGQNLTDERLVLYIATAQGANLSERGLQLDVGLHPPSLPRIGTRCTKTLLSYSVGRCMKKLYIVRQCIWVNSDQKELRVASICYNAYEHDISPLLSNSNKELHSGTLNKYICTKLEAFAVVKLYIEVYRVVTNV